MLITSVCFFIFFFVGTIALNLQNRQETARYINWIYLVVAEIYTVAFAGVSYRWFQDKYKWDMKLELYLFWLIYVVFMLAASFILNEVFSSLAVYWIMTAVLAIVPLWNQKEFLVSQMIQIAAIICLVVYRELGVETVSYLAANQLMCCIVSRQGYYNFLQRAADATMIDTAKTLSETDPMTKLLNRRGLEHNLKQIWPGYMNSNRQVAVMMIDIDNFKKYNDHFGHLEGDTCICRVTAEIRKMTRKGLDFAARVGGEEFVVCLTDMNREEALKWAVRLKENIEELKISQAENNFLPVVSVSIGITWECVRNNIEFAHMQKRADEALYGAKKSGRACVYMEGRCHAKTGISGHRFENYIGRGFRSFG